MEFYDAPINRTIRPIYSHDLSAVLSADLRKLHGSFYVGSNCDCDIIYT